MKLPLLVISLFLFLFSGFLIAQSDTVEQQTFTIVEEMPDFEGGNEGLFRYLAANIIYPKKAKDKGISGIVYVNFVVDELGNVTNSRILKGIGGGCDEEALRVVSLMPKWQPGKQRGKTVRVSYNLPIRFTLREPDRTKAKTSSTNKAKETKKNTKVIMKTEYR